MSAQSEGRLIEIFGAGTAAIVSPVGNIYYEDKLNPIPVDASPNAVSQRWPIVWTVLGLTYHDFVANSQIFFCQVLSNGHKISGFLAAYRDHSYVHVEMP